MLHLIFLIPILPLAAFGFLVMAGALLSKKAISIIAIIPTAASCVIALLASASFAATPPAGDFYLQTLGTWLNVPGLEAGFGFYLDSLSIVMVTVVTFVGLLILIYSTQFMQDDEDFARFFAYMNLFIASMLVLVLADNFLFLYLGWEGVGLCSYLLIGFWYKESKNCIAAIKAFIVTRIGDTLMAIGLFMLILRFHTLDIQTIMREVQNLPAGSVFCMTTSLLLLGGAVGKSAQLPLQTWLPDAMAGPTPVSALIHAATMVTAGVYLIARTHALFMMSPDVMRLVAVIGAITLLLAGFSALTQRDIKRVLAYSTISQIGYMFLALGVGAWSAAIFHFATHAFFKSALFLAAGVLIVSLNDEHDIFKMGGMIRKFPRLFIPFMLASLSLSALPPLSVTYNSKDLILNYVWSSSLSSKGLWFAGVFGAFLTAAYSFRLLYVVFFGDIKTNPVGKPVSVMLIATIIPAFISAISGIPELLKSLFGITTVYDFLQTSMPVPVSASIVPVPELPLHLLYVFVSLAGFGLVYIAYRPANKIFSYLINTIIGSEIYKFIYAGFGFDWLYHRIIVHPYIWIAHINRNDILDKLTSGGICAFRYSNTYLSGTVTGNLRWYAACIGIGAIIILGILIFL